MWCFWVIEVFKGKFGDRREFGSWKYMVIITMAVMEDGVRKRISTGGMGKCLNEGYVTAPAQFILKIQFLISIPFFLKQHFWLPPSNTIDLSL